MNGDAPILIVEDNLDLAENMAELLAELRSDVRIFRDGRSVLDDATECGFDLALVDLHLGDSYGGIDLLPRLKECCPQGEIILVTGNATIDTAVRAVRHGVFAYVLKPFDPEDLITTAERALSQVALRRERHRLSKELATSEALHRGLVSTVPAMIVTLDPEGRITFGNPCATTVTGWKNDELIGRSFVETCASPEEVNRLARAVEHARGEGVSRRTDCTLVRKDGRERFVRWYFALSRIDGDGAVFLAVGLDVTEQVELERKAATAQARAILGTLTAGLAHEIRNPLNAAKLQLELLGRNVSKVNDPTLEKTLVGRVHVVQDELVRLSAMLEEFLTLARPKGLDRRPFALDELVDEVVELHRPLIQKAGIELRLDLASRPCTVWADRSKIKQVLINLVRNAIDAMEHAERGLLEIAARECTEGVEVCVSDNGRGLPSDVAHQVFQPFVTTKEAGTGLGLTIVQDIIEQHAGKVSLAARPAGGAMARFVLPTVDRD